MKKEDIKLTVALVIFILTVAISFSIPIALWVAKIWIVKQILF